MTKERIRAVCGSSLARPIRPTRSSHRRPCSPPPPSPTITGFISRFRIGRKGVWRDGQPVAGKHCESLVRLCLFYALLLRFPHKRLSTKGSNPSLSQYKFEYRGVAVLGPLFFCLRPGVKNILRDNRLRGARWLAPALVKGKGLVNVNYFFFAAFFAGAAFFVGAAFFAGFAFAFVAMVSPFKRIFI